MANYGTEIIWQKATASGATDCVEVAALPNGTYAIRNSTDPTVIVHATASEMTAFAAGIRAGEFDWGQ